MCDRYIVHTYEDAHDADPDGEVFNRPMDAVVIAISKAKRLGTESREVRLGPAGDHEIFEVYPVYGYGTVVVQRITVEDDDA